MFTSYPTYARYRTLQLTTPHLQGEDVYALQLGLIQTGFPLPQYGADGELGSETATAIKTAQAASSGLTVDGLAGGKTQQAIAMRLATSVTFNKGIAPGALQGQLEHESGFRLGNYSPQRSDGSYDAGVAQRNTKFTDPKVAFDPDVSITLLATTIKQAYILFEGVPTEGRRWRLAQAVWNAPAFACWIAKEEGATAVKTSQTARPSAAARAALEAYMASVGVYLKV